MSEQTDVPSLDFGIVFRMAWRSVLTALASAPLLFVSVALVSAVFGWGTRSAAQVLVSHFDGVPHGLHTPVVEAFDLICTAFDAVLMAPIAVTVHRLILLEEQPSGLSPLNSPRLLPFALWTFGYGVAFELFSLLDDKTDSRAVSLLLSCAAVFFVVRLLLVFPAVAIDASPKRLEERVDASWMMSRGRFWLIALGVFFCLVPLLVIGWVPALVAAILSVPAIAEQSPHGQIELWQSGLEHAGAIVDDLLRPLAIAVMAAVASWVYMAAQEKQQMAVQAE